MRLGASVSGVPALAAAASMYVGVAGASAGGLPSYQVFAVASPNPQATSDSVSVFASGFGERLRTIGDVNGNGAKDILVANPRFNFSSSLTGVGRLWIFDGRTRELLRSIDDPAPHTNSRFGFWSAALGDVDGDGFPDFVTSGDGQNVGANLSQGEAFIFSGHTGALLRTIDDPDPQASADFGGNIVAPGDLNGDGISDFVVTASKAAGGAGKAYAFSGKTGGLLYAIPNPEAQASSFGFGAAELGDVNGDGIPDYQIGAPFYKEGTVNRSGRSYMISGKDGSVLHTLINPDPVDSARFGQADSDGPAIGDVNGDGKADVYVDGFLSNDGSIAQAGLGYLFDGASGNLIRRLHDPAPEDGGQFGTSDALAGDLDHDGVPDLIVGQTPHHNAASASELSKATVFAGPGFTNILTTFADPQAQANSTFGNSIASPGDVNGDGYPDYFVGARSANTDAGTNVGMVWAFVSSPPPTPSSPSGPTPTTGFDTTVPGVSSYGVTNTPFVVGGGSTPMFGSAAARRHKKGTTFRYTLSETATVKIVITQRRSGRRKGIRCVAPRRSLRKKAKCTRFTRKGTLTRTSHQGPNSVGFSGRIGSKALSPGSYSATITATDAAKNTSGPKTISFTIVKR